MAKTFTQKTLKNGVNLYIHSTEKFKTTSCCFFLQRNLSEDTATGTALLPLVLKRGTKEIPTSRKLSLYLEGLYGANMGADVLKRGEIQILQFYMDFVSHKYVKGNNVLDDALFAFKELILNPLLEGDGFKAQYVNQEKEVLRRSIESLYSDKMGYSVERCFREMCKGEPYSTYRYGRVEDLPKIDEKALYEHYLDCLYHCPADIFVLGDVNEEEIFQKFQEALCYERRDIRKVDTGFLEKCVDKERYVEDRQDINQGKLNMGFRTNTKYGDNDYYALMVYNGILGGGPHSKLFQNVREKASLAYFAFSRLEKTKGLMMVGAGIEFENYEKAVDIIKTQFKEIRDGKISDYEYESTIKSLVSSFRESADNPSSILSLHLDSIISGIEETPLDIIEKIEKVSKADVVNAAEKVCLETIYFLNKR